MSFIYLDLYKIIDNIVNYNNGKIDIYHHLLDPTVLLFLTTRHKDKWKYKQNLNKNINSQFQNL